MTDNPLDSLLFDENDILERVDEYSLYCRYLQYEPLIGGKYRSPLRPGDDDPSFGMFERKYGHGSHEFLWKDQALGVHGDIFDLVARLFNPQLSRWQAMQQICADVNLGGINSGLPSTLVEYEPQYTTEIDIRVISSKQFAYKELAYWKKINVDPALLRRYNYTAIQAYWIAKEQEYPSYPKGLGFAYRIWDKYQLYFPYQEKRKKFRTNWTDICVPGFQQLEYNQDLCIITKAAKDVACVRSFGYETVAPRGENIMLPAQCLAHLKQKYRRVVTLFDNDGKHKAAEYNCQELHVPIESQTKDPSDFCTRYGPNETAAMLSLILNS